MPSRRRSFKALSRETSPMIKHRKSGAGHCASALMVTSGPIPVTSPSVIPIRPFMAGGLKINDEVLLLQSEKKLLGHPPPPPTLKLVSIFPPPPSQTPPRARPTPPPH